MVDQATQADPNDDLDAGSRWARFGLVGPVDRYVAGLLTVLVLASVSWVVCAFTYAEVRETTAAVAAAGGVLGLCAAATRRMKAGSWQAHFVVFFWACALTLGGLLRM